MANFPPTKQDSAHVARRLEVDVEPLSEQRWAKIEQAVFARLDGPAAASSLDAARFAGGLLTRRWLPRAAAAVSLLVAGGAFAVYSLRGAPTTLSRVATGAAASRVALPGIVLDVSPQSAVVVSGSSGESQLIVLDRGEVTCEVAHRPPGAPLIVQAGEVQVEVVGTHFSVTRMADAARVVVQEGVVKVSARGQTTRVSAGESWPSRPVRALEPGPAPAPAQPTPDSPPARTVHVEAASAPGRDRVLPRRLASTSRSENALPSASSSSSPPGPTLPDPQAQFEAAAALEVKNPGRAIQLYQSMESGSSSWASNALFAHGRLAAARGNRLEARRILQQYLARSPQGPNAADARLLLGRLE